MTDVVTSQTLFAGDKRLVMLFTNVSDSTGESAVPKVDLSAYAGAVGLKINKVKYSVVGMAVALIFDHTDPVNSLVLQGDGCMDFCEYGGLKAPAGKTGLTGDIQFTTSEQSAGSSYTILLDVELQR